MSSTGVYRGMAADERRAARREQLLEAGLELLGTQGWAGTSVRGVCRQARLTPRFFYESFDDLDALAVAVFDEVVAAATARLLEAVASGDPSPEGRARAAIGTFVRELTDDPRRARVAFVEAVGSEPLMRRRLQVMRSMAELIAAHGREIYAPVPPDDTLVTVTATLLAGGIAELLITWLDGGLPVSRDELIDDCVALLVATAESAAAIGRQRRYSAK